MGSFTDYIVELILAMVSGFDSHIQMAVDVLTTDIFGSSMYSLAESISNVIKPIALIIITIIFLVEFLKITMKMDVLKWEYGLSIAFKLVLAKVAIDIAFPILSAIYTTVSLWIKSIGALNSTLGYHVSEAIQAIVDGMSWYEALGLVSMVGIVFLIVWISGIIVIVVAYARMFELLVLIAVSPLPIAFLPMEGSRITVKYFLNFASVCLQGLFILISIKLYHAICIDTLIANVTASTSLLDISFNMLLGSIVLVVAVVKSGSWAKAIFEGV